MFFKRSNKEIDSDGSDCVADVDSLETDETEDDAVTFDEPDHKLEPEDEKAAVRGRHAASSRAPEADDGLDLDDEVAFDDEFDEQAAKERYAALEDAESGEDAEAAPAAYREEVTFEDPGKAEKRHKALKIAAIAAGAVVGVLAVVYVAGALFFGTHFMPNTQINGTDVSWKAPADVQDQLAESLSSYELTVQGHGFELTVPASEIDYSLDSSADLLASVNQWAWPLELLDADREKIALPVTYNAEALDALIGAALDVQDETATDSVDAHLAYDEASDAIVVAKEQLGTRLKPAVVKDEITAALNTTARQLTLSDACVISPAILSDDDGLSKAADQLNNLTPVNLTLTLGGNEAVKVNKSNLLNWVFIDENFNVRLEDSFISDWAQSVAEKLNTYGNDHTYIRGDGKEITVSGGTYGWAVDTDELTDMIVNAIDEGMQGEMAIPCSHEANYYDMNTGQEWKRYVDVDLDEQHVRYYNDEGECVWESDCISGNVNYADRHTPTGIFTLQSKSTNTTLYTYEAGKKEPNKTVVSYWMPFVGNVYALHDAWWQPGFGGTMYRDGYGSHGCVNLPSDKAASLYNIIEVGDVVIVHW